MKDRWRFTALFSLLLLAILLAGCGGDDDTPSSGGNTDTGNTPSADSAAPTPLPPTHTPLPPPPRERAEPEGDPYTFEPPFSVGDFVRQSLRGNVTAVSTGGLQATYQRDNEIIVLKIYHFNRTADAIATVEDTLNASTIVTQVGEGYESPAVNFGIVQDRHGAYIAAWNNYRWAFIATAPDSLDALNTFLKIFQY